MPRGDRTGPDGMGPMTGRARGYCAGNDRPGFATPAGGRFGYGRRYGRGYGLGREFGRGFGRAFGRRFAPTYPTYEAPVQAGDEKEYLENELNLLKEDMKQIEARLKEIRSSEK